MEKLLADRALENLTLSPAEDMELSNRKRINGNAFYKAGKLEEAMASYHEASTAAPSCPSPLSNLSAVYFEMGDNKKCYEYILKAMSCSDNPKSVMTKAFPRAIKSAMHMHEWESAQKLLSEYDADGKEVKTFGKMIDQAKSVWTARSTEGELDAVELPLQVISGELGQSCKKAKKRLFLSIPRYKVALTNTSAEYFTVGHDEAQSLFDIVQSQTSIRPSTLCFAGIGDGRNLYATLIGIAKYEMQSKRGKPYHITINDINAYALARVVLILSLVEGLGKVGGAEEELRATVLATIYYVFVGVAMPAKVFDHFQATLSRIIKTLQDSDHLFRIDLRSCRSEVLKCLVSWRGFELPASTLLQSHRRQSQEVGSECCMGGVEAEFKIWTLTGMLLPPASLESNELREMLGNMSQPPKKSQIRDLKAHLADTWKPNAVMTDTEQLLSNLDLSWSPFEVVRDLYSESHIKKPVKAPRLFNHISPFIEELAKAWKGLREKITVEALLGDIVEISESLQHDVLDRPDGYPKSFDRLHLSNIPDYIGGFLTTSIFFMKITNPGPGHFVTANCLRNVGIFKNISRYHNEYSLISDQKTLESVMQVQHFEGTSNAFRSFLSQMMPPLGDYQFWWRPRSEPHPFSKLLRREKLKRWLFALFFKLCLPVDQSKTDWRSVVYLTLNISIYFRVLMHLHEIGYPAHWLSDVLVAILENEVISSARQPHTCPLEISEVMENNPVKKLSTAPYIPEMKTLTVLFQRILPFAVLTTLPFPKTIHRFSLKLSIREQVPDRDLHHILQSILVFYRSTLMDKVDQDGGELYKLLDPVLKEGKESVWHNPKDIAKLYEEGLMVISTWEWDVKSSTAYFWMASGEIERLFGADAGDWRAGVWGTMSWVSMHKTPARVVGNLKKGEA